MKLNKYLQHKMNIFHNSYVNYQDYITIHENNMATNMWQEQYWENII